MTVIKVLKKLILIISKLNTINYEEWTLNIVSLFISERILVDSKAPIKKNMKYFV